MQSTTKPWPPAPSRTESIHAQGSGSGQLGRRAGDAKNLWFKKSRRKRINKLKISTDKIRTVLTDEHMQELDEELRETRLVWNLNSVYVDVSSD